LKQPMKNGRKNYTICSGGANNAKTTSRVKLFADAIHYAAIGKVEANENKLLYAGIGQGHQD
jgi:hypothetical protein